MDLVYIKNLRIETIIGIYDWEREVKQLIRISYEVEVEINKAFQSDNIDDTFDYKNTSTIQLTRQQTTYIYIER